MVAGTADPSIAHYTPRSSRAEIAAAFEARWIHGMNTQAPWNYVKSQIDPNYKPFLPKLWFIGVCFFQWQTAYWKTGVEMNYGLFSLGTEKVGETGDVCSDMLDDSGKSSCGKFPVYCLDTHL